MNDNLTQATTTSRRRGPSIYLTTTGAIRMSAFAPVTNSTGALTAIVGIDAGSAELEILERMRSRLYWIAAGCAALTLVAALIFARSITRPIRHIAANRRQARVSRIMFHLLVRVIWVCVRGNARPMPQPGPASPTERGHGLRSDCWFVSDGSSAPLKNQPYQDQLMPMDGNKGVARLAT